MTATLEPISDLKSWSDMVNNRREKRIEFRTTGTIFPPLDDPTSEDAKIATFPATKVWTVDVSTNGALVKSFQPIPQQRVLLELLMPELSGSIIEGELVRQETETVRHLNGKEETAYLHGVQFKKFVTKSEVANHLTWVREAKPEEPSSESVWTRCNWQIELDERSREKAVTMLEFGFILLVVAACAAGLAFLR